MDSSQESDPFLPEPETDPCRTVIHTVPAEGPRGRWGKEWPPSPLETPVKEAPGTFPSAATGPRRPGLLLGGMLNGEKAGESLRGTAVSLEAA